MMEIKNSNGKPIYKGVTVAWCSTDEPTEGFSSPSSPLPTPQTDDAYENMVFQISIFPDTIADYEFALETHPNLKNLKDAKLLSPEEVTKQLRLEVPATEPRRKITFRQKAMVGKGARRRRAKPIRVFGSYERQEGDRVVSVDDHGNEIKQSTVLGNGTRGHFQFAPVEIPSALYGYPECFCVTSLKHPSGAVEEYATSKEDFGIRTLSPTAVDPLKSMSEDIPF